MAISVPLTGLPVAAEERTWRANLETPVSGDYSIQVYREVAQKDDAGAIVGEPAKNYTPIRRQAADVADETVTVTLPGGATQVVSAAMVMLALPMFFDKWAEADAAPLVPPAE
jgi:hypothetical protein